MKPERWEKIKELCHAVLERSAGEREQFLEKACFGDESLRKEVESLLAQQPEAKGFIKSPALEVAAETLSKSHGSSEVLPGTVFADRYEIVELLGRGGMGRVYKAFDREVKETVALKLLLPEIEAEEAMIERFRNELKLARAIGHRNVCRMYDLGKAQGMYYLTMEFVPGEDLKSLIRRSGPLPLDTALRIGRQIAEGLAEAHRLGVVHRDLKSQNIMIDKGGNARIMDFGIARGTGGQTLTQAGMIVGTPDYMSPELWDGKPADPGSDIYALGVILYEMTAGRKPFTGDTPFEIGYKHRTEIPRNPQDFNQAIPETLNNLILACLEKEPGRRHLTAGAVAEQLMSLGTGAPVAVAAGSSQAMSQRLGQFAEVKDTPARSIAVLPFTDMSDEQDQEHFCDGIAEELITSLTKIGNLRVAARTSAFFFRGKTDDIREIGHKLNVETVVEGSVRKAGNKLRITAQLINVADGYHLWSERWDRELRDIFAIQDEVTEAIIDHLKLTLLPAERQGVFKRRTNNLEAHNLYLRGLNYLWMYSSRGFTEAIRCFEQALEKDPDYAQACWGLSEAYLHIAFWGNTPPTEACRNVKIYARKALALDPTLGDAHGALSYAYLIHDFDWKAAEREALEAIRLSPNSSMAHAYCSFSLLNTERFDAGVAEALKAQSLDPVSSYIAFAVGSAFGISGDFSRAIEEFQAGIRMNPDFYILHWFLGMTYAANGQYEEAVAAYGKAVEISQRLPFFVALLAMVLEKSGGKAEADALWREVEERAHQEYVPSTCFFFMNAVRGKIGAAVRWLRKAGEAHDSYLCWMRICPAEYTKGPGESLIKARLKKLFLKVVVGRIMARNRIVEA